MSSLVNPIVEMVKRVSHRGNSDLSTQPADHPSPDRQAAHDLARKVCASVAMSLYGKEQQIELSLACLLAGGHLLIEDIPGVGKTTLAHALAGALGLRFNRFQFTADAMPAEIVGSAVFDRGSQSFNFHPGPIFAQVLLGDEINRASARTQSALLEAMEEGQVSVDGITRELPFPFFVIATQNPSTQLGTFPLPESQLDRFLMCISLGYPGERAEKDMLRSARFAKHGRSSQPQVTEAQLKMLFDAVDETYVSEPIIDYVYRIAEATRTSGEYADGLSPRSTLSLLAASRAWAMIHGRDGVLPDDVRAVYPHHARHRLRRRAGDARLQDVEGHRQWLAKIPLEA